jgi:transposase-like protein
MKMKFKTVQEKESMVAEYLLGGQTYRLLGKKYNFDYTSIHLWVMEFKGLSKPKIHKEVTLVNSIEEKHNLVKEQL